MAPSSATSTVKTATCRFCKQPFPYEPRPRPSRAPHYCPDHRHPANRNGLATTPIPRPWSTPESNKANAVIARRESGRRRDVDPTTCERQYSDDDLQFQKAVDRYKQANRRPFPTLSELLEIVRSLGYRRVAEVGPLPGKSQGQVAVRGRTE